MRHFFYSLITFVISIFFMLIGIGCMLIPWVGLIRTAVINFITTDVVALLLFGFAFFTIGIVFLIQVILASRKKYYYVRSGKKTITVDENLIQECLSTYWKAKFPQHDIPFYLALKENKIHITVDLPYVPSEKQQMTIERIEDDITHIFTSTLGYRNEFFLNISFNRREPT